mmetsp:Transcript_33139/g.49336  ORF Transcript_33139/g.49336 Transcript_33139/m.49336 type:complete len:623 (-) Transcript_33139:236-2104(-)
MQVYNLEAVKAPRLCGMPLDLFSRLLRVPIIKDFILKLIKRKNKIPEMVRFANSPHCHRLEGEDDGSLGKNDTQHLMPLYYPVHEMTKDEAEMHQRMVKEAPLDLKALADANVEALSSASKDKFRYWTISDYTSRYLDGSITPTQVVDKLINIIEEMNSRNQNSSVVTQMNKEELQLQAAESTKRYQNNNIMGVLDGVPILVKDEIPTVGHSVTLGTSFISDRVEKDVVLPIIKLKQQGVLIVGKTNQHEIGIGTTGFNLLHGTPKNPYGRDGRHYYTGGSTSGSAAAVAMGLVPLAVGADGGGSIRIPSGLCGIVGLKATYKRVARDCSVGCSVSHAGPMANNVHDAALAYAIMAGEAENDHRRHSQMQPPVHLHAYLTNQSTDLKGLRIGIFDEHIKDSDENVQRATKRAIEHYQQLGAEIVPITLPHLQEIHMAHAITISTEMYSLMEEHYQSSHFNQFCPESRVSLAIGRSWSSSEFLAAQKVRSYAMHHIEVLFQNKVDIILSPATPCTAPLMRDDVASHGESNLSETAALMKYMIHGNLTGIPGLVFPIAYDDETSLPISLQLQAAHWREDLLFRVARQSQDILRGGITKPALYVDVFSDNIGHNEKQSDNLVSSQ